MQRKNTDSPFDETAPSLAEMDTVLNASRLVEISQSIYDGVVHLPDDDRLAPRRITEPALHNVDKLQIDDNFRDWTADRHRRWGVSRFRYNWDGNQDDRYNQVLFAFFLRTFDFVARAGQLSYATATILASTNEYSLIMAQTQKHFEYLSDQRRKWLRNPDAMIRSKDINRAAKLRGAVSI